MVPKDGEGLRLQESLYYNSKVIVKWGRGWEKENGISGPFSCTEKCLKGRKGKGKKKCERRKEKGGEGDIRQELYELGFATGCSQE